MTDMLVRTPELGVALAQAVGLHPVALMRGHGAVVVASGKRQVVPRLPSSVRETISRAASLSAPGTRGSGHRVMDRRCFLLTSLAGALVAPLAAEAQQVGKVHRIGLLGNAPEPAAEAYDTELRERGWLEGQNFVWERRFSEGRNERLPALAADLVQRDPM
jgi:hypothetical protein